jgi:hypothetical protein
LIVGTVVVSVMNSIIKSVAVSVMNITTLNIKSAVITSFVVSRSRRGQRTARSM